MSYRLTSLNLAQASQRPLQINSRRGLALKITKSWIQHHAYLCIGTFDRISPLEISEKVKISLLIFLSAADESLLYFSLPCLSFDVKNTTVTALSERFLDQAPKLPTL